MKILVIGSKGFIGSSICKFYSENDSVELWQCDVFENTDNDPRYFSINSSDINFENIFRLQSFDICINAAGSGNVGLSFDNPLYDFESNTYGVIKILEAIRMLDSKCRFINFSSAAVYGDPKNLPIRENSEIKPLSPYGFNKAMAEHICKEYFAFFGIKTCNLRVFSAYGPGLKKQIFWDIYQKFKLAKNEIEMFGTGEETRDFIYIDDLVNAIDIIINKSPFQGECINVASGSEVNIADASKQFLNCFSDNVIIRFNKINKQGDPLQWKADIENIRKMGFTPNTSITEGTKKYAEWLIKTQL